MSFYRRNLPHWQPKEAEYFVTFRLSGSLPKKVISDLRSLKQNIEQKTNLNPDQLSKKINHVIFRRYEKHLDGNKRGPFWLQKPEIATLVCNSIKYRDDKQYDLYSYCIMPNHVHLVFKLLKTRATNTYPVTKILGSLKKYTARKANKILNREGQFWQHESFDRVIRNKEELQSTIKYVLNNPVKAELIRSWEKWPYSFCKTEFKESLL